MKNQKNGTCPQKMGLAKLYLTQNENAKTLEQLFSNENFEELNKKLDLETRKILLLVLIKIGKMELALKMAPDDAITTDSAVFSEDSISQRLSLWNSKKNLYCEEILGSLSANDTRINYADNLFVVKNWEKAAHAYENAERRVKGFEQKSYCRLMQARALAMNTDYEGALKSYAYFEKGRPYFKSKLAGEALVRAMVLYCGPLDNYSNGIKVADELLENHPQDKNAERILWYKIKAAEGKNRISEYQEFCRQYVKKFPNGTYAESVAKKGF